MHIGLILGAFVPPSTPGLLSTAARAAEERGFHSLWVGEHVVLFDESLSALDPESLRSAVECMRRRAPSLVAIAHP